MKHAGMNGKISLSRNELIAWLIFALALALAPTLHAQTVKSTESEKLKNMEERIQELEQHQQVMEKWYSEFYVQSQGRVAPFLGEKISFGGYLETVITHMAGPDMATHMLTNTNTLGLNIAAEFNEKTRFVSQFLTALGYPLLNPHNNPALTPSERQFGGAVAATLVAQGYVEFTQSDMFNTQIGVGYVPFGFAYQQREPVLFRRRGGPQLLGSGDGSNVGVAFPLWTGVHFYGNLPFRDLRMGYNLYTISPSTKPRAMGLGGRLWWAPSENVTWGASVQSGEQTTESYLAYGTDVNIKWRNFGVTAEYAYNAIAGIKEDVESYYIEPYYTFADGEWLVYLAADYLTSPNRAVGAVADPYNRWQYGAGVNWLPLPNTRLRLGYTDNKYYGDTATIGGQERRYQAIEFSTGIAF